MHMCALGQCTRRMRNMINSTSSAIIKCPSNSVQLNHVIRKETKGRKCEEHYKKYSRGVYRFYVRFLRIKHIVS